jgi:hypothetical protein
MSPTATQDDLDTERLEYLSGMPIADLARYVIELEDARRRLINTLEDERSETEQLKATLNSDLAGNYDRLVKLSETVTSCAYGHARVVRVESRGPMTAEITLEAAMSAGDTMHLFPGDPMMISGALLSDFVALENYYMEES